MHVTFGPFLFDGSSRQLQHDGQTVHLSPKAFDLLGLLLRRRPGAISKQDLHGELWPETFVSDGGLAVLVTELRRALGDSAQAPRFIRTINRFGYAFVADLHHAPQPPSPDDAGTCFLVRGGTRTRLQAGSHVIGRDPDAAVCIDAVGVSRRHAMLEVTAGLVVLRDLGSKNGTFVDGGRITAPVELHDGAELQFGAVAVLFQQPAPEIPTQTVAGLPG